MTRLVLKPGHIRRVQGGHPWIFSNEIQEIVGDVEPGCTLEVCSPSGNRFGVAYYNPHSLIAARILAPPGESIDHVDFFHSRLETALEYRSQLYPGCRALRLVFGESDGLPGLVVDLFEDVLVVQLLTLGMDLRRDLIVQALVELLKPKAILARNDVAVRGLEGLPQAVELLYGTLPETLAITEHGLRFKIDVVGGQKTGHFLDQKENHLALKGRVEGRKVLDLFCYSGSWSVHAGRFGATEVTGIDISPDAIELAQENASANYLDHLCQFEQADVFDLLRNLQKRKQRFGTVVLDPPAFVKSKKKLVEAMRGYLTINRRAMELIEPGGYLFSCSCSHHMQRDAFLELLRKAARQAGRRATLLEVRGQSFDHPVLLSCPETDYLKCAVLKLD